MREGALAPSLKHSPPALRSRTRQGPLARPASRCPSGSLDSRSVAGTRLSGRMAASAIRPLSMINTRTPILGQSKKVAWRGSQEAGRGSNHKGPALGQGKARKRLGRFSVRWEGQKKQAPQRPANGRETAFWRRRQNQDGYLPVLTSFGPPVALGLHPCIALSSTAAAPILPSPALASKRKIPGGMGGRAPHPISARQKPRKSS